MNNSSAVTASLHSQLPDLDWQELLQRLAEPFDSASIQWRAGSTSKDKTKALAFAYADTRVYEARLDKLCPGAWEVSFEPWGNNRIICTLTIHNVSRSSTGEDTSSTDNSGTSAEAQSFKRACSKFGLGRYLYDLPATWVPYDTSTKRLKETPSLPATPQVHRHEQVAASTTRTPLTQVPIGNERAIAMHRELTRIGIPHDQHRGLASEATGTEITSLADLTERQAKDVWNRARRQIALN